MRKIITTLSLATALFAGQTMADQATVNTLQAYGVPLSTEHNSAIANAEGQRLVDAIAQLVAAQPSMAATTVAATMRSNPSLTDAIVAAAIAAAPGQEQAINDAVAANKKKLLSTGESMPSSSIPAEKIRPRGTPSDARNAATGRAGADAGVGVGAGLASPN